MRAIVCKELGAPLSFEDVPSRLLAPGELRVEVHAAGVNFADTLLVSGQYQEKPKVPFVPGLEAAGVVTEVASDVVAYQKGDRVLVVAGTGAFAEELVAPAIRVHRIPDGIDFATAAAMPVVYGTAHLGLGRRADLRPEETLVVHGASGGVGLAAVEVGRAMGARVIATASSAEKIAKAVAHGAHEGIDTSREDVRERIKALTGGRGAEVIFDTVGGPLFEASVRSLAWEGRLVVVGFASGALPQVPAGIVMVKNVTLLGLYWGKYLEHDPHVVHESLDRLIAMLERGRLHPEIETMPLADASVALERIRARKVVGKIVLRAREA
jgi:NADPH2:quinone reductase